MKTLLSLLCIICLSASADDAKPKKSDVILGGFKLSRYETKRVIILSENGQEEKYAKHYEAVWKLAEKIMPKTLKKFPASKKNYAIILKDESRYRKYNRWSLRHLKEINFLYKDDREGSWDKANAVLISFDREQKPETAGIGKEYGLGLASFTPKKLVKGYSPVLINFFAQSIFHTIFSTVKGPGEEIYARGFGYYCENTLCGGCYTRGYASQRDIRRNKRLVKPKIRCSELFAKSNDWVATIKDVLQKRMYPYASPTKRRSYGTMDTPVEFAFAFGLVHYMVNNQFSQGSYDQFLLELLDGVKEDIAVPSTFGFAKVYDFKRSWEQYMKSDSFK